MRLERTDFEKLLYILDMFDSDIGPLIAGSEIDNPYNALTLHSYYQLFRECEINFEHGP